MLFWFNRIYKKRFTLERFARFWSVLFGHGVNMGYVSIFPRVNYLIDLEQGRDPGKINFKGGGREPRFTPGLGSRPWSTAFFWWLCIKKRATLEWNCNFYKNEQNVRAWSSLLLNIKKRATLEHFCYFSYKNTKISKPLETEVDVNVIKNQVKRRAIKKKRMFRKKAR